MEERGNLSSTNSCGNWRAGVLRRAARSASVNFFPSRIHATDVYSSARDADVPLSMECNGPTDPSIRLGESAMINGTAMVCIYDNKMDLKGLTVYLGPFKNWSCEALQLHHNQLLGEVVLNSPWSTPRKCQQNQDTTVVRLKR